MKETMRRLLSLVLAWVMLLSMTPLSALAADGDYYGTYSLDGISVRATGEKTVRVGESITIQGSERNGQWRVSSGSNFVTLTNSDLRTVTVTGKAPGRATVEYGEYSGWWGSTWNAIDSYTVVVGPGAPVTITYNQNVGWNSQTRTQEVAVGSTLTFPDLPDGWQNGNQVFAGWSTDSTGQTSEGEGSVFRPNIEWTSAANTPQPVTQNTTFYAIWINPESGGSTTAYFHIKLNGDIPFEPGQYGTGANGGYTANHGMTGTLRNAIAVNNDNAAVAANIASAPSMSTILSRIKSDDRDNQYGYSNLTVSAFEEQYTVVWYVVKAGACYGNRCWHVDGVVVPKANYWVSYHPNGGTGAPQSHSQREDESVTVRFDPLPTRSGYTFLGWSEDRDATTPTYTADGAKTFTMPGRDVTLYAVWEAKDSTPYTIEYYFGTGDDLSTYTHDESIRPDVEARGRTDSVAVYAQYAPASYHRQLRICAGRGRLFQQWRGAGAGGDPRGRQPCRQALL